jgi:hypothetical protein
MILMICSYLVALGPKVMNISYIKWKFFMEHQARQWLVQLISKRVKNYKKSYRN